MSSTMTKYSLSEVTALRKRGEDESRPDAPEAESLGKDFWKSARVVKRKPMGNTAVISAKGKSQFLPRYANAVA